MEDEKLNILDYQQETTFNQFEELALQQQGEDNIEDSSNINLNNNYYNKNITLTSESTKNGVCKKFLHSKCLKETQCPYSHDITKIKVCHHFMQGQCRRGEDCDFSHLSNFEKNNRKPICKFLNLHGICTKQNCNFRHVLKPCRDFDKGFCTAGNSCKFSHLPKKICLNYTYGFCPNGPNCEDAHPKLFTILDQFFLESYDKNLNIIKCYGCGEIGHKITNCYKTMEVPLNSEIYCFKCKNKHPADECNFKKHEMPK